MMTSLTFPTPPLLQSRLARRRHRNRTLTDEASAEYRKRAAQMITARSAAVASIAPKAVATVTARKQVNISPTNEHGSSDNNG